MAAAFGSGVMFTLVSGMGGPNQPTNVITSGLFFALVQGGLFKVINLLHFFSNFGSPVFEENVKSLVNYTGGGKILKAAS